jgi:hypothetical protein
MKELDSDKLKKNYKNNLKSLKMKVIGSMREQDHVPSK